MNKFYIDLGSSTIKILSYDGKTLELVEENSIYFKNGFSNTEGISKENLDLLKEYFVKLKKKYSLNIENAFIYATGIFRNIPVKQKNEIVKYFSENLNLYFNVISHGIENYYLGKALEHDYNGKKVLIVNMGGKTTELVTFEAGKIIDRTNLSIGVADMLNEFPEANNEHSPIKLEKMVSFVKNRISDVQFDDNYDCAIFTGGELRFEKLTKYDLENNDLFNDNIHDKKISLENFIKGNKKVFYEFALSDLYNLMPFNPKWMDGARGGVALAQGLFERANVKFIIPSDLNLINGVVKDV